MRAPLVRALGYHPEQGGSDATLQLFLESLRADDLALREAGAHGLRYRGSSSSSAVTALLNALRKEPTRAGRDSFLLALGEQRPVDPRAVGVVTQLLQQSRDESTRSQACQALSRMASAGLGSAAPQAVPALAAVLSEKRLAGDAWRALAAIGPDAAPVLERAVQTFAGGGLDAHLAARVLVGIGPPAAKPLLGLLGSPRRSLRRGCARLLQEIPAPAAALRKAIAAELYADVSLELHLALRRALNLPCPRLKVELSVGPSREALAAPSEPRRVEGLAVRPGGRAKRFRVRTLERSALTEDLVRDWPGLDAWLRVAQQDEAEVNEAWHSHLDPRLTVRYPDGDLRDLLALRLCTAPLAQVRAHVGERLHLGDLVEVSLREEPGRLLVVGARLDRSARQVLFLREFDEHEGELLPPAYLSYPDVLPNLSFWAGETRLRWTPLQREHVSAQLGEADLAPAQGPKVPLSASLRARLSLLDEEEWVGLRQGPPAARVQIFPVGSD